MKKIMVAGFGGEVEEFEIMDREDLEVILEKIDDNALYKATWKEAHGYDFSGRAITYLDARNGEIKTYWMQSNNYHHPYDSFYEIPLCTIKMPVGEFMEGDLLDPNEQDDYDVWYEENGGTLEEYIKEVFGRDDLKERIENALDFYAERYEPNWDRVDEFMDRLYEKEIKDVI